MTPEAWMFLGLAVPAAFVSVTTLAVTLITRHAAARGADEAARGADAAEQARDYAEPTGNGFAGRVLHELGALRTAIDRLERKQEVADSVAGHTQAALLDHVTRHRDLSDSDRHHDGSPRDQT